MSRSTRDTTSKKYMSANGSEQKKYFRAKNLIRYTVWQVNGLIIDLKLYC